MSIKPLRAFPENVSHRDGVPQYQIMTYLMMDISDLVNSHFNQKVKSYDFKLVKQSIKRFNEFYGTKLSNKVVFENLEKGFYDLDENGEYEWTDVKEFEKFWNRHAL